jgi:hypothetical protein
MFLLERKPPNILSIYQKCSIIHRKAALSITWLKQLVDSVVPLFEREQALTITPLPLGTSAARSFVRVAAAVAPERVNVDPFHRAPVSLVVLVHPASSTRLTQIGPVGSLVTGAAKLRIYERLQKQRAIAVTALPIRDGSA